MGNTKNALAIIVSALVVIIVTVLVFLPISSFNVPGSYKDFNQKSAEAMELNDKKQTMLDAVSKKSVSVKEKQDELSKVTEAADKSKELFSNLVNKQSGDGDWSYHVPSLLIRLEDAADKRNIKLAMDYDTFKAEGDFVSDSKQGLKVVKVDVKLYGLYADVQSYIKSIEGIDFVSVEDLMLKRVDNGYLAGNYKLNVYYLEK